MKRHLIATSAGLAALTLLLLWAPLAMANISTANTADIKDVAINRFQVTPVELPEIDGGSTATFRFLSSDALGKLLAEKAEFLQKTRPLIHELKSKWAALTEELAGQASQETTATRLQTEISTLDTQLTAMRLDHFMALNEIRTNTAP